MLVVYEEITIHELREVKCLVDFLSLNMSFSRTHRAPTPLPAQNLTTSRQGETFFIFLKETIEVLTCIWSWAKKALR